MAGQASGRDGNGAEFRRALLLLALAGAAWLVFNLVYPNSLGGTDVFHFKDPGCNLALGRGFTSPSYVGTRSFDAKLWFSQGPAYPLLYGAYASVFGCDIVADNVLTLAISLVLCAVVLSLVRPYFSGRWYTALAFVLAILAPTGGYQWPSDDRPDHLALLVLLLIPAVVQWRLATQGGPLPFALAGLAFVTSPFYGVCALAIAVALFLAGAERWLARRTVAGLAMGGLVFAAFPAVAMVGFTLADAGSVGRFLAHTQVVFADHTIVEKIRHAVLSSGVNSVLLTGRWLLAVPVLVLLLVALRSSARGGRALVLPAMLGLLVLATPVFFMRQNNYYSAIAFIALVVMWWRLGRAGLRAGARPLLALAGFAVLLLPLLPWVVIEPLRRVETIQSFRAAERRAVEFGAALSPLAPGHVVLVPASHYFLYKNAVGNIFDPAYLFPGFDPQRIDAQVVCRAGTRPGDAFPPPDPVGRPPIAVDTLGPPAIQVHAFGLTLMRRYADWSCLHIRYR